MPGSQRSHCPELFQHRTRSSKCPLHCAPGLHKLLPPVPTTAQPPGALGPVLEGGWAERGTFQRRRLSLPAPSLTAGKLWLFTCRYTSFMPERLTGTEFAFLSCGE